MPAPTALGVGHVGGKEPCAGHTQEDLASGPEGLDLGLGCGNPREISARVDRQSSDGRTMSTPFRRRRMRFSGSKEPALGDNVRVLLAGRAPPRPAWLVAAGWSGHLTTLEVGPLPRDVAPAYPIGHGIEPAVATAFERRRPPRPRPVPPTRTSFVHRAGASFAEASHVKPRRQGPRPRCHGAAALERGQNLSGKRCGRSVPFRPK